MCRFAGDHIPRLSKMANSSWLGPVLLNGKVDFKLYAGNVFLLPDFKPLLAFSKREKLSDCSLFDLKAEEARTCCDELTKRRYMENSATSKLKRLKQNTFFANLATGEVAVLTM